ncbi:MAG: hypothetical protein VKO21_11865 [Candidatus Sericytochromatia bacterium]|nr:hypothetical protein [Candidatus Sericytochromatia bacterium]
MNFAEIREVLDHALAEGPRAQRALVAAVDASWAWLDAHPEASEDEITDLRVRLAHAENLIGRYFGS